MDPEGDPEADRGEESAYDAYLEAALRGEAEEVDAFLARRGGGGEDLRRRLEGIARVLGEGETAPVREELPAASGLPLDRLGGFRLIRRLGEGGMGIVFLAEQESLRRLVALKVVRPERGGSPEADARFRREGEALAKLRHPNVVSVFATGEDRGVRWIAMELVPGRGLDDVLRESTESGERVPVRKALAWAVDLARALAGAHAADLVHRDLKPSNVRITPEGRALLVDFGLARGTSSDTLTRTGEFRGTPQYASPEQVSARRGGVDARTDVYLLGVTLYECLTGAVPFEGETTEQVFHGILAKDPIALRRRNPEIPRDVETVVLKAMEKEPERRYETADAFARDLAALLEMRPIAARPAGPWTRGMKWARRNRGAAIGAAGVAASLLVVAGVLGERSWRTTRAVEREIEGARGAAADGRFDVAIAALDRALGLRPDDAPSIRLRAEFVEKKRLGEEEARRARARRAALAAIDEGRERREEREGVRHSLEELRRRVAKTKALYESAYLSPAEVEAYFADRESLVAERRRLEEADLALFEALHRAARHDPEVPGLDDAFAEAYLEKWQEAVGAKDEVSESLFRRKVEEHDREGRWAEALAGTGTIAVEGSPAGAEVFLFRYELHAKIRPGGERRLVPVPWHPDRIDPVDGGGSARPESHVSPGDVVLAVEGVEPGSPADRAGIRPGDLVTRVARGEEEFAVAGATGPESSDHPGPAAGTVRDLLERPLPPEGVSVRVRSAGRSEDRILLGPSLAGIEAWITAAPLLLEEHNRLGEIPIAPFRVPPGSYLLLVRAEGFEDLRLPIRLDRGGEAQARADLLPRGATPEGFVWIPLGRFLAGGDPDAMRSWEESERNVGGFWMQRREVSRGEYLEFLNDPETLGRIDAAEAQGGWIHFPRTGTRRLWARVDGRFAAPDPGLSVNAISWDDVEAYVAWRTRRANDRGEPWVFDIPTEEEWEKAARGADGRDYPWGDEFVWSFACGRYSREGLPASTPPESYPRDESPWGCLGLAGNVSEFCAGWMRPGRRPLRGGGWGVGNPDQFRAAYRNSCDTNSAEFPTGFRLVARLRGGGEESRGENR